MSPLRPSPLGYFSELLYLLIPKADRYRKSHIICRYLIPQQKPIARITMAELGGSDLDSDDELLNFQAFSNKKQKREINKDDVLTSRAPRTSRSGSKVEKTVSNETKALRIVSCASVPSEVRHPRDLYWHKEIKKRGSKKTAPVQWHPCRTCHPDDATGLDLPEKWDQSKKSLVQYIEGTGFKHLSLVGKSTL
eukprot:scaffold1496_cov230-Chaetoceros_neogracile.AAC.2